MTTHNQARESIVNTKIISFQHSFESPKSPEEIFELLLQIDKWWTGLFQETITGESQKVRDEFSFKAGGGVHYSKQQLVELEPPKKIVWLVTVSNLSFLKAPDEWTNTRIRFDLASEGAGTRLTFTHEGLTPQFECYDTCTSAWTQYLERLEAKLK